jgi:Protein of unknown function (DUF2752)
MDDSVSMTASQRLAALGVAALGSAPLLVAAWLVPASAGMGTHRQLGLPSCSWPVALGIPCITCGMTTSFALAVRAQFAAAAAAQPAGLLLALAAALAVVVGVWGACSGRPVHRMLEPLASLRALAVGGVALALAWAWKIAVARGVVA